MSNRVSPRPSGTDGISYVCSMSSGPKHCCANGFEDVRSSGVDSGGYVTPVMNWWFHKMRTVCWLAEGPFAFQEVVRSMQLVWWLVSGVSSWVSYEELQFTYMYRTVMWSADRVSCPRRAVLLCGVLTELVALDVPYCCVECWQS